MPAPIPVLLASRELDLGGCERDLTRLAVGLDRERFEPHVACFRSGGYRERELQQAGVPILDLGVRSFRNPTALSGARRLIRYLRRRRIAIFHAFDIPAVAFGVPLARAAGTPVVLAAQLCQRDLIERRLRWPLRLAERLADRVVVNCAAVADELVERRLVPREKTALIPNGVDTRVFHPPADRAAARRILPESFRDATAVIGAVSVLRPEKSVETLIEAFAALPLHAGRDPRLVIVGDGERRAALERLAAERGVAERVHFAGRTNQVADWMRAFDVYALPSLTEAFPNTLLEAMASGCAAVGSRVGGVPEMLGDDERGLLFPPGDAAALADRLSELVADPDRRRNLADAAARFAREALAAERFIERNQALYDEELSRHGSSGATPDRIGSRPDRGYTGT